MQIEEILIVKYRGVSFGISTSLIGQILRVPEITSLALSPEQVRGLCAVSGSIVTVLDFNLLLGLEACSADRQENRVVTLGGEWGALALLVDEVSISLSLEEEKIEYLREHDDAICAIYHHGETLIQIVDLAFLISSVVPVNIPTQRISEKNVNDHISEGKAEEMGRYLVLKMGSEKYGMSIEHLREILSAHISITPIAGSHNEIEGMMSLREELMVVADLRRYFGYKPIKSDKNRIVIAQRHGKTVGLMIDEIIDIREFSEKDIDRHNARGDEPHISGVIRDGENLISLIGTDTIDLIFERNAEIIVKNQAIVLQEESNQAMEVVIFHLGNEEFALNIEEVAEIIDTVPVTPVAEAPELVEGVINIRGQIVTIGSLYRRLGIESCAKSDQKIIICHAPQGRIGFFVNSVSDVMGVKADQIRPEDDREGLFSSVLHFDEGKRLVMLFNPDISKLVKGVA